jgi:hypothetical protein
LLKFAKNRAQNLNGDFGLIAGGVGRRGNKRAGGTLSRVNDVGGGK